MFHQCTCCVCFCVAGGQKWAIRDPEAPLPPCFMQHCSSAHADRSTAAHSPNPTSIKGDVTNATEQNPGTTEEELHERRSPLCLSNMIQRFWRLVRVHSLWKRSWRMDLLTVTDSWVYLLQETQVFQVMEWLLRTAGGSVRQNQSRFWSYCYCYSMGRKSPNPAGSSETDYLDQVCSASMKLE